MAGLVDELDDLIWEVDAIAHVIRRPRRATYHLLATNQLPARKIGGRWCASKRRLLAFLSGEAA